MAVLDQELYPLDLNDMVAWVARHVPAAARVLEIGCGDGALTRRLADDGFDVTGIDPHAPDGEMFRATTLEQFDSDTLFDASVASVSLHHASPEMAHALRARLVPGAILIVREFDKQAMDHDPTLRWWHCQLSAQAIVEQLEPVTEDFDAFAAGWRVQMAEHVRPWADLEASLTGVGFDVLEQSRGAYLYRFGLTESLRPLEESLIARGKIHPVGIRFVARLRG